ncbi:imidazole glycerol phosphate synthase subunit HisH [Pedobacter polysacchareus]|uniref:imidazole glycerol phosphate synthase subunit HisH n=1 Tax=Pedobacter polysacchareus TaxID=2861973 RepID=UPI001C9A005C|nr:imidazole glycerol phosphate synthase subunit HisH [Pedobacter polysacchareus]
MIALIDYGVGNIRAFTNIYKQLNLPIKIAKSEDDLIDVTKIILPGVGAFDHAMDQLNHSGMRQRLDDLVLKQAVPVVGICVGMQMLANSSDEGKSAGLGWINASVKKFDESKISYSTHLPHMGWNDIKSVKRSPILEGLEKDAKFYFLHSYYFHCNDLENTIATTDYGIEFCCAVNKDNIYGVQFHPEKSHQFGIQLLNNFAKL